MLRCVQLSVIPWTAARRASLSFSVSWSFFKFTSIESVMISVLSSVAPFYSFTQSFPASESFPLTWLFESGSLSIGASASVPPNEYSGLISFRIYWFDLLKSKGLSRVFSNTTVQKHQLFGAQLSLTRSSVLAWRIPGMEEPGGLPSMGLTD